MPVGSMYGARTSVWHTNAIPETIGQEAAKRLYSDPEFAGFADDIKKGRTLILQKWPKQRTTLVNAVNKRVSLKAKPEEVLAHLMQGVEAQALKRVMELYPNEVVLLMHNGWVCTGPVDIQLVQRELFDATGYSFQLEGGLIQVPADLEFSKTRDGRSAAPDKALERFCVPQMSVNASPPLPASQPVPVLAPA